MNTTELLEKLCQSFGVAGEEGEAVACAQKICKEKQLGITSVTPLGSLICTVKEPKAGQPHFMLNAHIDEIGMIVTAIDDKGFIKVMQCGGVDKRLLMASPIIVHAGKESFQGVVGCQAAHLQKGDKKYTTLEEAYVDLGMTKKQAEEKIPLGSRISFEGPFTVLRGGLVASKAMDDRSGCAAVIMAAEQLLKTEGDFGLTVMLSSQEETGGVGAKTAAFSILPTEAIVVDVTFGTTPEIEEKHCGKLKEGAMIGVSPVLDGKMGKKIIQAAKDNAIPYQVEVMGGHTGTDADGISATAAGIACACLSIPLRYMHTPVEVVAVEDVENTANLIAAYINSCVKC